MSRFLALAAARDERGATIIFVTIFMTALLMLSAFVMDVGNWFEHRRHLQMQADAAALAGAARITQTCSESAVYDLAGTYGGLKAAPAGYNQQVGGTPLENVLVAYNAATWPEQPEDVDPTAPSGGPCDTGTLDVKLAEKDLPLFFNLPGFESFSPLPYINAHARVEIRKVTSGKGFIPIGIPDVRPRTALARFVNEATGEVLAEAPLCRGAASGGLVMFSNQTGTCTASGAPAVAPESVRIKGRSVGVQIVLSGSDSTTCGDPLVQCYDEPNDIGVLHIRGGDPGTATATQPRARNVRLLPGTCPDAYFVDAGADCEVGIEADVDFGVADPVGLGARVNAVAGKKTIALIYVDDTPADGVRGVWRANGGITVPAGGGTVTPDLEWTTDKVTAGDCKKRADGCRFADVQRAFSASADGSGPIRRAVVQEDGAPPGTSANSFARCESDADATCVHDLVVGISIQGALPDVDPAGPPVVLRLADGNQTQALDCDPSQPNFKSELVAGCAVRYGENEGEVCPKTFGEVTDTYEEPYPCVPVATGGFVNQIPSGLNERILGDPKADVCTNPNRWDEYLAGTHNLQGDPRLIQMFTTPFGAFDSTGGNTVPVTGFAAFYITGWTGQGGGFKNPCEGNGDDPVPADAQVVGHFVVYIDPVNEGQGGEEICDFGALQICVPILTR